jgi:hypothetical protein
VAGPIRLPFLITPRARKASYGEARGDESTRRGRQKWLREAQRALDEQRAREQRPIPRIDPIDGVDHKPREVILRQPIPDVRRQQERLLTITRNKAGRHNDMVLN